MLAIKLTLYRTSGDSPIIKSLIRAAERGKQVAALVELKARFDEAANIVLGQGAGGGGRPRRLRPGRAEDPHQDRARRARRGRRDPPLLPHRHRQLQPEDGQLYEDLGLLTSDEQIGADLTQLFNFLTGYGRNVRYRKLLVAPGSLRQRLEQLIRGEMDGAAPAPAAS